MTDEKERKREETRRAVFRAASYLTMGQPWPEGSYFTQVEDVWVYNEKTPRSGAEVIYEMYRSWVFT